MGSVNNCCQFARPTKRIGSSLVNVKFVNVKISETTIGMAVNSRKPRIHGERKIQPQMRCWRSSPLDFLGFGVDSPIGDAESD